MISAMGNKEYEQEGMLYLSVELHRLKFFVDDEFESIASALRETWNLIHHVDGDKGATTADQLVHKLTCKSYMAVTHGSCYLARGRGLKH